jgi:hypothetical protein
MYEEVGCLLMVFMVGRMCQLIVSPTRVDHLFPFFIDNIPWIWKKRETVLPANIRIYGRMTIHMFAYEKVWPPRGNQLKKYYMIFQLRQSFRSLQGAREKIITKLSNSVDMREK